MDSTQWKQGHEHPQKNSGFPFPQASPMTNSSYNGHFSSAQKPMPDGYSQFSMSAQTMPPPPPPALQPNQRHPGNQGYSHFTTPNGGQNVPQSMTTFPYQAHQAQGMPPQPPPPSGPMTAPPPMASGMGQGFPHPPPPPLPFPPQPNTSQPYHGSSQAPPPDGMQFPPNFQHTFPPFPPPPSQPPSNYPAQTGSDWSRMPGQHQPRNRQPGNQQNMPRADRQPGYQSSSNASHTTDTSSGHQFKSGFERPKLSPYQSRRSRQNAQDQRTASPHDYSGGRSGMDRKTETFGMSVLPFGDQEEQSDIEKPQVEETEDQKWVKTWLKGVQICRHRQKEKKSVVRISDAKQVLWKFLNLLEQLKVHKEQANESVQTDDDGKWELNCVQMKNIMEELASLQSKIRDQSFQEGLKDSIRRRRRKRERRRRHREEEWEMKTEKIAREHERINAAMAKHLQAKQEKEQEEALQKEVDNTLSEVRKKKQEVHKSMELLRALRKLRKVKRESAERQGFTIPEELDVHFDKKVSSLETMMNKQKLLYVEEEKALQVMLEEEHEETRERERQKKQRKERERAEKAWKEQLEILFGECEELHLGHPLFMFRQFQQQADNDILSLINIRRQWDVFLVPETDQVGTSIPVSWVTPSDPSNHIWATALELAPSS
ncbi:uncharacterized protein [Diadema antillarum]|uniref:uncharacterized protein n=1 Tax=Diadema antillarum TaxID=105358 RepID=UPI003A88E9D2